MDLDHLKFMGYSYLWMFPIWGTAFYAAELESKAMTAKNWPFYVRKPNSIFMDFIRG